MVQVPLTSSALKAAQTATILLVDDDPFQAHAHRAALERYFANIERAADATEAFIRIEEPGFRDSLAMVIAGLRLPGMAGPAFVSELIARLPLVPILVIGRPGETASDYAGQNVHFLPSAPFESELLAVARRVFSQRLKRVA